MGRHAGTQARNSLNQALHEIRKLETTTGAVLVERESGRLRFAGDGADCDLHRFETLLDPDPLAAAALYAGELLEGFDLPEDAFTDWLTPRRSHYRARLQEALLGAAHAAASGADHEAGMQAARRRLALDPLDERARRLLMPLLARTGNRCEALRQYRICEEVLRDELGVHPEPETRALGEAIRRPESMAAPPLRPDPRLSITAAPADGDRPVVAAIEPSIESHEFRRVIGRPPATLTAYELLQRGYWHLYRGTAQEREIARHCFEAAVESDPGYACALAGHAAMDRIRADQPGITLETMVDRMPFTHTAHREHLADGLRRAGWRDAPGSRAT